MALTEEQTAGAMKMAAGIAITLAGMIGAVTLAGPKFSGIGWASRCAVAAASLLAPALTRAYAIARLARHRLFSAEDIAGSASSKGSDTAMRLQSLIQNTLEQAVLAILAYASWCALAPSFFIPASPMAAALFLLGRVLFFAGYAHGARSRALGFAPTFYPTLALILGDLCFVFMDAVELIRTT